LEFVATFEQGYDIVYGERVEREEAAYITLIRKIFYRMLRALADDDVILDMAEFSLIAAPVREAIIQDSSSFPFIRASISRVGFRRKGIAYKRHKRIQGESHYDFIGMTKFAVAGILSSSTLLLRIPIYSLPFWLLLVLVLAVGRTVSYDRWWDASLIVAICFYLGCSVSFIAIYVARIYKNTLGRPNYVIDRRKSFLQP
jgi:dolichol-phosphate mannosyltransferase